MFSSIPDLFPLDASRTSLVVAEKDVWSITALVGKFAWMKATGWDEISLQFHSTQWRVIITHYVLGTVLGPGLPEWIKSLWELPVVMPLMLHWDYFSTRPWAPWQHHCVLFVSGSPVFLSTRPDTEPGKCGPGVTGIPAEALSTAHSYSTTAFDCAELFPVPRGPMLSFSLGSSYFCSLGGLMFYQVPRVTIHNLRHIRLSSPDFRSQKSRHTLAAQVLMDLNRVSGLYSSSGGLGSSFQAHSDGYQSSVPCWLCTQCHAQVQEATLLSLSQGQSTFQVSNGELLTQQIPSCFKSLQLWSFLRKELVPSKGSCDEVKLREDNLMFSVNYARWHNLITEAKSHPLHRFLPLHDRGDSTRMGLFGDHFIICPP